MEDGSGHRSGDTPYLSALCVRQRQAARSWIVGRCGLPEGRQRLTEAGLPRKMM